MTNVLEKTANDKIHKYQTLATRYTQTENNSWEITLENGQKFSAKQVIFCVGGFNRDFRPLMPKPYAANP